MGQSLNTQYAYAIRNAGQSLNTQYAYAIRNTQCGSKPIGRSLNTQYAIRNAGQSLNTRYAIRNTQYAMHIHAMIHARTTKSQNAIRNTQYAMHIRPPIRNTQYAIRKCTPRWLRVGMPIRNTQYAIRHAGQTGRLRLLQYAIRNTQYANPVKPRMRNTQNAQKYAIAQYAAYGVPHTDA